MFNYDNKNGSIVAPVFIVIINLYMYYSLQIINSFHTEII